MIGKDTLNFLINSKVNILNSNILTLGNPFLTEDIFTSKLIKKNFRINLRSIERNKQIKYLLRDILGAKSIDILDISEDEGADHIFDFNRPISEFICKKKYNIILDFGTSEHIFNRNNVIENIFKLMDIDGIYIFHLPAGGQLDHGFITYSPSFMYDLCFANREAFSLLHLSLFHESLEKGISTLPLYEKLDKHYKDVIDENLDDFNINTINLKYLTGFSYRLFNYLPDVMLLGAIRKNKDSTINHNAVQCLYRNMSLEEVLPKSSRKKNNLRNNLKNKFKNIFLYLPLPALIKLKILIKIARYI